MFKFKIILTELCNANCSHCYMAFNKSQKTMTEDDICLIINNMPLDTKKVVFTGGEVFLAQDLLLFAIKTLKEKFVDLNIGVETNGIVLYKNWDNAKTTMNLLKGLGVSYMRFSDDPFHETGGVDLQKVRKLAKVGDEIGLKTRYLKQEKAVAIGKAVLLSDDFKKKGFCMNTKESTSNTYIFLDVDGNASICSWECIPPVGNMKTDSWEVIQNNLNKEFYQLILSGNILEAINLLEEDEKIREENGVFIKEHGECMLCNKIFSRQREYL